MRSSGGADQPAGAVAEHVDAGVAHGREQARRHLAARHPQLGVHAGHDDVELGERARLLVERRSTLSPLATCRRGE